MICLFNAKYNKFSLRKKLIPRHRLDKQKCQLAELNVLEARL